MRIKKKYVMTFIVVVGLVALGCYAYHWENRKPLLEVNFFSLNRGRAIFIRTPKNKTILIGGGQNSEAIQKLTSEMPFYRHNLDTVIIPSAVPAQIGGLIEIIDRYEVGEVIIPATIATSTVLNELMKDIRSKKIHIKEVERGDEIEIERDLKIHVLFPNKDFKFNKTSVPELGIELEYQKTHAFLIGNLSKTIQKDIRQDIKVKDSQNIVEFYNSMADGKVSEELLELINPIFTWNTKEKTTRVISDGFSWNQRD